MQDSGNRAQGLIDVGRGHRNGMQNVRQGLLEGLCARPAVRGDGGEDQRQCFEKAGRIELSDVVVMMLIRLHVFFQRVPLNACPLTFSG